MAMNIVVLDKIKHAATKIKPTNTYDQFKNQNIVPIAAQEFVQAAAAYPIIFVHDPQIDSYRPVVLMGLKTEQNLFCTEQEFTGYYLPLNFRTYPFTLTKANDGKDEMIVCLDENSDVVNEEEGQALFDENGEGTEFLKYKSDLLRLSLEGGATTRHLVQYLVDKELIVERSLTWTDPAGNRSEVTGTFVIDHEKLNALSEEDFLEMRKRGYLPAIYAQIASLNQITRLGQAQAKLNAEK